jgi:membrane-associated phospholipid phosphatase
VIEESLRLKDIIPYKLKDASRNSFPADHALFLFLMYQYARKRLDPTIRKVILSVVVIFTLPRLISGGHWLTDAFFGGWVPAALFAQAWLGKTNTSDKTNIDNE